MMKRILSLLLAFQMLVSIVPVQAFATDSAATKICETCGLATCTSDHADWCEICKKDNCGVDHKAATTETEPAKDPCPYCEETTAADGTVTHANTCNTNYKVDASADVGKTAAFNLEWNEVLYSDTKPTEDFVYYEYAEDYGFRKTTFDPEDPALVEITNWYWEVSGPTLWYQVKPLQGEALPEGLTTESWILQHYTNDPDSISTFVLTDTGIIGKAVAFKQATATLYGTLDDAYSAVNARGVDGTLVSYMIVKDLYTDGVETWYYVDADEGKTWPEGYGDCHYVKASDVTIVKGCAICGKPDCDGKHVQCGVCGAYDCTKLHFYCEHCKSYSCTKDHIYCSVCGKMDCTVEHVWCGICGEYDCRLEHEDEFTPDTTPVIPANPTLTPGQAVSIADEDGNAVTAAGLRLTPGKQISLSAWGDLAGASYQWQIRYDAGEDLWVDIQGQTGQGILISPAIFQSIIAVTGSAAIRCTMTAGEQTQTSAVIPVSVAEADDTPTPTVASLGARHASTVRRAAAVNPLAGDEGDDLQKSYVVVQYVYADGRTAASSDFAEVIPGTAVNYNYTLPVIPGYKAELKNASTLGSHASLVNGVLTVTYAEGELAAGEYATITVEYKPDYVRYTIIHYWQNIEDDRYTEYEREVIDYYDSNYSDNDRAHRTGEVITDAHKSYPGFYNLLYETPAAAADGSTVIEVYYDRYYYLMKFDLGENAYGVDPVYARYGDGLEIGTPTRAGYTFLGWELNGTAAEVPTEMPAENRTYTAKWQAADTAKVSIIFWGENAKNESYSYLTTGVINAEPGTEYTFTEGNTVFLICGKDEHTHTTACRITCGKVEHTQHTEDCLGCNHVCGLECYSAGDYGLVETNQPSQLNATSYNGIYTYTTTSGGWFDYTTTHYYLYFDGKWYCAKNWRGNASDTTEIKFACDHSHTDACYTCEYHAHTIDCYSCGLPEHTHDRTCNQTGSGLDRTLWKFVRSETAVVQADGSTQINVYYDRTEFTLTFRKTGSNGAQLATITDKWGAPISARFQDICNANTFLWSEKTSGESPWTSYLDIMPQENRTYYAKTSTSTNVQTATYYVQRLDGSGYDVHFTSSVKYGSNLTVSEEEFVNIEGYTFNASKSTKTGANFNGAKFYYDRHLYAIEFYNPTSLIRKDTGITYGSNLSSYDWTPTSSDAPNLYEPGSVRFAGWYLSPDGAGDKFVLADNTMPSAPEDGATALVLYAKWEPVEHKVNYYLSRDSLDRGENIPTEMSRLVAEALAGDKVAAAPANDPYTEVFAEDIVKHGGYVDNPGAPGVASGYEKIHPYTGYDFIGWFYLNEDGHETAFDPANIPVDRDLNLYAKWSSNTMCYYNVYFALDVWNNTTNTEGSDGIPDVGPDGNVIYIADPITGSAIAGRTYTFSAKGGEDLYDPEGEVNYREGYFPTVGSHSITIDIADTDGIGANSYTFLYQKKTAVPYTVRYINAATGETLLEDKVVADNKNVIVTENFVYIQGYMPDAYQKTLVVTDDGNAENDVIIFRYTKDEEHALYVVNYYIEDLDADLNHAGWSKYTDTQSTGTIGEEYTAEATAIDGFTLSASYTNDYNTTQKINGMTDTALPTTVSALNGNKITGTLTDKGMELNFYYTRNLYPYEFRYMLNGTNTQLAEPEFGKAGFDTSVTGVAKEIVMDLDGDGINEDYRLYDPTEVTKDIHIIKDGETLTSDAVVTQGQATVNVATFYYVRCTQTMTITKTVVDKGALSDPDPDQAFSMSLLIHAKDGYHRTSYDYTITEGTTTVATGTLSPAPAAPNTLQFALEAGQTITIEGLPTAEYTVSELNLPVGYYDAYAPAKKNKLTVDSQLDVTVTNTYDPAMLHITKTVDVVEENGNVPEITDFEFTVKVPAGVTGSYDYKVGDETKTATVVDGGMTVSLQKGQTATFLNLPIGTYTVTEKDYSAYGYDSNYKVNKGDLVEGASANVTTVRGTEQEVEFLNKFPVGDLTIEKTVTKEFDGSDWSGDTFTFTVERTTADRPLLNGNKYNVFENDNQVGTATVVNGKLEVALTFDAADAAEIDEADEQGESVTRTLVIKNLPVGTYDVTEAADAAYVQSPDSLTVTGLEIPAEVVQASFTNTLRRGSGDLYLEKELVAAPGFHADLPEGTKFSFTVELLEAVPAAEKTFAVVYSEAAYTDHTATATNVTMTGGKFTLTVEAGWHVTVKGLPEGKYRITEATIPQYANAFAHRVNGNWTEQSSMTTTDGQLYTEIEVGGAMAEVKCTNTYPVDKAELVLQKVVTQEYPRDVLPDADFSFQITLAEKDMSSYEYKVYDDKGVLVKTATAEVTNKSFDIVLEAGQYAVIPQLPVCGYTVTESVVSSTAVAADYNTSYAVYVSETGDTAATAPDTTGTVNASGTEASVGRTFSAGKTDTVVFTNKYRRHLGTLTITKTASGGAADDTFLFHIKGADESNAYIDMDVTITGSGSLTVYDLPMGTYTVTEDTSWSWRYNATSAASDSATLTLEKLHGAVSFTNTSQSNQWLNHFTEKPNVFGKNNNAQEGS